MNRTDLMPHLCVLLNKISRKKARKAFTLVELLIVIAILAVLAAAVVMVLNPAELLAQARDSQRVTDLKTLKDAIDIWIVDNPSTSMGTSQTVYISVPDTSSTCANIAGLPTLPAGWAYHCVTEANLKKLDATGWIPLNFTSIYGGSPVPYLPIDPQNNASLGKYYTYTAGGSYEITALLEAEKNFATIKDGGRFIEMYELGSNLSLLPVSRDPSLMGYWPFEGTGSISNGQTVGLADLSGKGNNGTASNINGTGMSFVAGKVGNAVQFDGVDDYVVTGNVFNLNNLTLEAWIKPNNLSGWQMIVGSNEPNYWILRCSGTTLYFTYTDQTSGKILNNGQWYHVVGTFDGTYANLYVNGSLINSSARTAFSITNKAAGIGAYPLGGNRFNGLIDDIRIYNRALTASEIQAVYNAGK